jgi:hypothetical protein
MMMGSPVEVRGVTVDAPEGSEGSISFHISFGRAEWLYGAGQRGITARPERETDK